MIRGAQFREAKQRYREMAPVLNEQSRRRFAALEAGTLGHGGVSAMARISGLARSTIYRGLLDIRDKACAPAGRIHTAWNRLPYSRRLVGGLGGLDVASFLSAAVSTVGFPHKSSAWNEGESPPPLPCGDDVPERSYVIPKFGFVYPYAKAKQRVFYTPLALFPFPLMRRILGAGRHVGCARA